MNSIFRFTILAVFCGFIMQSVITAQDKSNQPQTGKPEKAEKIEKTEKAPNGLAPLTIKDLAVDFPDVEGWREAIFKNIRPKIWVSA